MPGRTCRRLGEVSGVRIDGSYRPAQAGRGTASRSGAGSLFRLGEGTSTREAAAVVETASAPTIDSLLALQAVADPLLARKKAIRRGTSLLDALDAIKADLLAGRVGEGRLNALMALLAQVRERSEPALDAVIDEVELRARVELAKLGRYPA
jgi:hypothetical protein